jgi:hypothetical protein
LTGRKNKTTCGTNSFGSAFFSKEMINEKILSI